MKWNTYLKSAITIIDDYDGDTPLSFFLKNFFRLHKQMGSRDRKAVSALVYHYFRLGHSLMDISKEEKIFAGLFLCGDQYSPLLEYFRPDLNEQAEQSLEEKQQVVRHKFPGFRLQDIFPWKEELSAGIDHEKFCLSFLRQPKLFIRTRLNKQEEIAHLLQNAGISFEPINDNCIALPNGTSVENIIAEKSWYVIQDYSSQRTAEYFNFPHSPLAPVGPGQATRSPQLIWDCCAGSGGKSILFHDLYPGVRLFVSDARASIIHNLHKRFREMGIRNYQAAVIDLTKPIGTKNFPGGKIQSGSFDGILADVPCSGSGTWSRTPEQLYFFRTDKINEFRELQQNITRKIIPCLKKEAPLIYLTCSVFRKENEERINSLQAESGLHLERSGLIPGYEMEADTMFAARLMP